jgi:hypothetical protein
MIEKNQDPLRYCDYCKHNYRRSDGSFKPQVRSAVIVVKYEMNKGRVPQRALCQVCLEAITNLPSGYWSFRDQLDYARKNWEQVLDV